MLLLRFPPARKCLVGTFESFLCGFGGFAKTCIGPILRVLQAAARPSGSARALHVPVHRPGGLDEVLPRRVEARGLHRSTGEDHPGGVPGRIGWGRPLHRKASSPNGNHLASFAVTVFAVAVILISS